MNTSAQQRADIITSINCLLKQLDLYRISHTDEFEALECWIYENSDLTLGDAVTVLRLTAAALTV